MCLWNFQLYLASRQLLNSQNLLGSKNLNMRLKYMKYHISKMWNSELQYRFLTCLVPIHFILGHTKLPSNVWSPARLDCDFFWRPWHNSTVKIVDRNIFLHYSTVEKCRIALKSVKYCHILSNNVAYCRIFKKYQILSKNAEYCRVMSHIVE